MIPLLSDLRESPVVGRYYMVPVVRYYWLGAVRDWPVLGPLHHDKGKINFPALHYHIDGRFLPTRYMDQAYSGGWINGVSEINQRPMSENDWTIARYGHLPRKTVLKRRRCSNIDHRWGVPEEKTVHWGLAEDYGSPAPAIARPDGRPSRWAPALSAPQSRPFNLST